MQSFLGAGLRPHHLTDEIGEPTAAGALVAAYEPLYLSVAATSDPKVDPGQVWAEMQRQGYGDWARQYEAYLARDTGNAGENFNPDASLPLLLEDWQWMEAKRRTEEILSAINSREGKGPLETLNSGINRLLSVNGHTTEVVRAGDALLDDLNEGIPDAVPTGCALIDSLTGGVYRGYVAVIGAPPKSGKTSTLVSGLSGQVRLKQPVVAVEDEMRAGVIRWRMLANLARVKKWQIQAYGLDADGKKDGSWNKLFLEGKRNLKPQIMTYEEEENCLFYQSEMNKYVRIYNSSEGGIPSLARRHKAEFGNELASVWWDHMGFYIPASYSPSTGLKEVTDGLSKLARDENIAVIAFSQLGAPTEEAMRKSGNPGENPQFSYSGGILKGAGQAIMFCRATGRGDDGDVDMNALNVNIVNAYLIADREDGRQGMAKLIYDDDYYDYRVYNEERVPV